MKKILLILVLVVLLGGGAYFYFVNPNAVEQAKERLHPILAEQFEEPSTLTNEEIQTKYFDVNFADVNQKLLGKTPFLLYFHASDCLTCTEMDTLFQSQILENKQYDFYLAKTDFNNETKLKQQFGVNFASSVVLVDKEGSVLEVLVSPTLEQIVLTLEMFTGE